MKKLLKVVGIILFILAIGITGMLIYVSRALPNVGPAPDIQVQHTSENIERGKYLATTVTACIHCHSPQQKTVYAHPIKESMVGAGGNKFGEEEGLPGNYYSSNLTPENLGDWTDGEIYRAITAGVSKDGRALFPIMPWPNYAKMEQDDIYSIIAYLRTLEPIENEVPASESFFPMNFIINTMPVKSDPVTVPAYDRTDRVSWGRYLVTAGSCQDCHTMKVQGADVPGMDFAGGMDFQMVDGSIVRTANITPDTETGIGGWTEEQFINRFKQYADSSFVFHEVDHGEFNTSMPWKVFSGLSEEELGAIYTFLRTIEPVKHKVTLFTPTQQN